jgi:hypothetical protein
MSVGSDTVPPEGLLSMDSFSGEKEPSHMYGYLGSIRFCKIIEVCFWARR